MKIDKAAVLAKIDAYYQREADRIHTAQTEEAAAWSQWVNQQKRKTPNLVSALTDLIGRLDRGEFLRESDIRLATEKYVHDFFRPEGMRRPDWHWKNNTEAPVVEPRDEILDRLRSKGRFKGLQDILEAAVGDTIAVSMLKDMGVLSTDDARLLFASQVSA